MLKKVLIILTVILVLINFLVITNSGYYERRLIRLISIGCYGLVFLIFKGYKDKRIALIFIFLALVDFLGLFYEYGIIDIIGPVVKLTVYLLIISEVIKKVKIKNINKPVTLFLVIIILLNIFLIFQTVWATFIRLNDYAESVVYLLYGAVNVAACIVALNYNFIYGTRHSICYLYLVFNLILSDASWFIGYYLNYKSAFYFDALFYLFALYFLIIYALDTDRNEEVLLEE